MDIAINSHSRPDLSNAPWSLQGNNLLLPARLTSRDEIDGIALPADGRSVLKVCVPAHPEEARPMRRFCGCFPRRFAIRQARYGLRGVQAVGRKPCVSKKIWRTWLPGWNA
jgi:hypothetical protein